MGSVPVVATAAILAGGKAERLGGRPKGLLEIDGRRIVDRQLEALRQVFARVLLVANDPRPWAGLGLTVVPDRHPGAGPLAGLDAALAALAPEEPALVCVAGDMPLLEPRLLMLLRDHAPDAAAVVPLIDGRPEPLCARYGRACAAAVAAALAEGRLKTGALLDHLEVNYLEERVLRAVDPALASFTNINAPEDVERVSQQVRSQLGQR